LDTKTDKALRAETTLYDEGQGLSAYHSFWFNKGRSHKGYWAVVFPNHPHRRCESEQEAERLAAEFNLCLSRERDPMLDYDERQRAREQALRILEARQLLGVA
jgi:hypothetical protein